MADNYLFYQHIIDVINLLSTAPVMFQEFIPAAFDVRLTVVNETMVAVRICSQQNSRLIDWRVDLLVPIDRMDVPESIIRPTLTLMNESGLDYGALDLRVTPQGENVFLEINRYCKYVCDKLT